MSLFPSLILPGAPSTNPNLFPATDLTAAMLALGDLATVLDPSYGVSLDTNQLVQAVSDPSPAGAGWVQATAANRPSVANGAVNGRSAFLFSGAQRLDWSGSFSTGDFTKGIVVKPNGIPASGANPELIGTATSSTNRHALYLNANGSTTYLNQRIEASTVEREIEDPTAYPC